MNLGLDHKVAAVTGAARGIGAAVATLLAEEGCDIAIIDCAAEPETRATVKSVEALGRRAIALHADVRDHARAAAVLAAVVADLGRLDIVVCSAGITDDATLAKMTEEQWDSVLGVNLKGVFNYNKAAAVIFRRQNSGKIVNIASINGMRGKFGQANYAASKAGIIALSKSLARELGPRGVNVNVIAPGMIATEMSKAVPGEFIKRAIEETALGRIGSAADCAHLVAFLCSDCSRHITGAVIRIDGGQYM